MARKQNAKSIGSRPPTDETDTVRDVSALKEIEPHRSIASDFALGRIIDALRPRPAKEFRVPVRRPDDMLVFDILVDNLTLKTDGHPRLERTNASVSSHLIIEFPPQSFGEEAFLEVSKQSEPNDGEPRQEVSDHPDYPEKNVPTQA